MTEVAHPVVSASDVSLGARTIQAIEDWYEAGGGAVGPPDFLLCRLLLALGYDAVVYAYRRSDGPMPDEPDPRRT